MLEVYRNVDDLCAFILYPATLLKLSIISTIFLVDCLGFFKQTIITSAKSNSLVFSLPILIPSISFYSLIATASVSSTMVNNRYDNGHPCFTPDLIGNAPNLSPLQMILADGFKYILFTIFDEGPSYSYTTN